MRSRATILAIALTLLASPGAAQSIIAIRGATIIDGMGTAPQSDHTVIIRNDRIAGIGPVAVTPIPRGARVIEGKGLYIVPGFIDVHASVWYRRQARRELRELDTLLRDLTPTRPVAE